MLTKAFVTKHSKKTLKNFQNLKGFQILRLSDFLKQYKTEIQEDFHIKYRYTKTSYDILCLVDCREDIRHTMSQERRKKFKNYGKWRRDKIKEKYHYSNIYNRIHGFLILEEKTGKKYVPKQEKVISLSLVCSSSYSNKKGIGSALMNFMINSYKDLDYTKIILEVAIDHVTEGYDSEEEYYTEYSESDEEEIEEYSERESEIIYKNSEIIERLSKEFLRKTLRHSIQNGHVIADYAIGEEYISEIIYSYMNDIYEEYKDDEFKIFDPKAPGEYDYGGYYFQKGRSETYLLDYYTKFGFREDPKINLEWQVYSIVPYPTMVLDL